jgi:hypothetical protein
MAVAEGKKRYYLTLTESTMQEFKQALSEFGAPPGFESVMVDEYIQGMVRLMLPTIKRIHESGKQVTFADCMVMVGAAMKDLENDQLKL